MSSFAAVTFSYAVPDRTTPNSVCIHDMAVSSMRNAPAAPCCATVWPVDATLAAGCGASCTYAAAAVDVATCAASCTSAAGPKLSPISTSFYCTAAILSAVSPERWFLNSMNRSSSTACTRNVRGSTTAPSSRKHCVISSDSNNCLRAESVAVARRMGYDVRNLLTKCATLTALLAVNGSNLVFGTRGAPAYVAASAVAPTNVVSGTASPLAWAVASSAYPYTNFSNSLAWTVSRSPPAATVPPTPN